MLFEDLLTVYRAELLRRARSRAFLIGLFVGGIGVAALARLPAFMVSHAGAAQTRVVLSGPRALTTPARAMLANDYDIAAVLGESTVPSAELLARYDAGRLVALTSRASRLQVVVYSSNPSAVDERKMARLLLPLSLKISAHLDDRTAIALARFNVRVQGLGSRRTVAEADVSRGIGFTLIFFLYLLVVLNSQLTMASVIEEKTNRIAELLVAAVDPLALLYGKILAGATLGLLQMIAWMGSAFLSGMTAWRGSPMEAAAAGSDLPFNISAAVNGALTPLILAAFAFYLVVGLLQFSTLFAGVSSLISRPEDFGTINAALILPIIAALIIAIAALDAPNSRVVDVASYLPLLAPFTMFARIAVATPPVWDIVDSAVVNLAALFVIAILAGRLYRVGMLLYGRMPNLRQIWTTIRG